MTLCEDHNGAFYYYTTTEQKCPISTHASTVSRKIRKRIHTKKGVTFFPRVAAVTIAHRSDYTVQEKHGMWYTKPECAFIHNMRRATLARLDKMAGDTNDDDTNFCSHGLYRTEEAMQRLTRICTAQAALFQEQCIQRMEEVNDPERLADLYCEATMQSRRKAIERAARIANADSLTTHSYTPHRL
jgi:hypothetical protein